MQYQRHECLFWHIYQWTSYRKENNKLKHRSVDTTPSEAQRNKKSGKQNILGTIISHGQYTGISEGIEEKNRAEEMFDYLIAWSFMEIMK